MICIIPARGGSTRIPRKNIKDFHGKPIIAYSIEAAQKSGLFDENIYVSSDDMSILRTVTRFGARPWLRSDELGQNEVGTQEVARDLLVKHTPRHEYACVIYATSPLLKVEDLIHGYETLKASPSLNYVYSVDQYGVDAGCFYWGKTRAFIDEEPLTERSVKISLDYACDINVMDDWNRAHTMFLRRNDGHKATLAG